MDSEAVKFATALAQVEAKARADAEAKQKARAAPEVKAPAPKSSKDADVEETDSESEVEADRLAATADTELQLAPKVEAAKAEAAKADASKSEGASASEAPASEASASEASASEASASETSASEAPASEAPASEAPASEAPASEAPASEAPASEAPASEAPKSEAPKSEAPKSEAPTPSEPPPAAPSRPAPKSIVPERGTPAAARAAAQQAGGKRALAHTMLGLSDEVIKAAGGSSAPPPARDARDSLPRGIMPTPISSRPPNRGSPKGTLLGIQTSPGSISAPGPRFDQTQIEGEPLTEDEQRAASSGGAPQSDLTSTRVEGSGPKARTALGLGIPQSQPPKRGVQQGRTMLGVPVASISPPASHGVGDAARSSKAPERTTQDSIEPSPSGTSTSFPPSAPPGKISARSRNVMILGGLALLSIIVIVYLSLSGSSNNAEVSARIMTGTDGETLLFEVPEAREGSSIRFGGQEQPLAAGKATFALASDSLRVGENVVLADVVSPDGDTASARIVLSVFYRIWVDTSSLRVDKPSVDVIVTAVPGTKVTLEGQDVPLDNQGRATKTYPIDIRKPGKGGLIEHVVNYRMQPPEGEPVVDQLHTRIAVAMMQIDRPGPDIVTDRDSIEIAGAVGRDTQVDVDGAAVPVKEGRFLHTLALSKPGDYKPRVTAKASGKIPFALTLNIKRVRDLAQAAREFNFNKDLNYAKLAANPSTYKGEAIAMEGRVYATVPRAGSSVIQMLARPCPTTQRCSVWVVDPQGNEVSVDKFVRVLGTVDGEQQFRSEKNEIVTVPKIIARFVLPAKP
jgi:hypothetical protein